MQRNGYVQKYIFWLTFSKYYWSQLSMLKIQLLKNIMTIGTKVSPVYNSKVLIIEMIQCVIEKYFRVKLCIQFIVIAIRTPYGVKDLVQLYKYWMAPYQHQNHCWLPTNGPLVRYIKLRDVHAPGIPETFSPPPRVSDPGMHHGTCVMYVPWCMPGSLTSDFSLRSAAGKTFQAFPGVRNPQFCVSEAHGNKKNTCCANAPGNNHTLLSTYILEMQTTQGEI